jgi:sugar phosphate isomerase/epimerase
VRLPDNLSLHLTYSMNVFPGITLDDVEAVIRKELPPLKARFSPDAPFGVGLWLAGQASNEILEGDRLDRFRALLDEHGLYVFTMNGFPYGPFHGEAVKGKVHLPDWQDEERLGYTFRLSTILAKLLPDDVGEGSISTSPLGYKPWVDTGMPANWMVFTLNIVRVVQHLIRLREETGKLIHIDLEPEPDGVLGNGAELVAFYERWLLTQGVAMLADRAGNDPGLAREQILDHVRVCFDTGHIAVGYEDPAELLDRYAGIGIKVGKVQVGSALKVTLPEDEVGRKRLSNELAAFNEPVYLHQVIQRNADGSLETFDDLPDALPVINDPQAREWRVHYRVPVFMERCGTFTTTQDTILETFRLMREREVTDHLEVETYTWDILPDDLKTPLGEMTSLELQWVLDHA